MCASLTKLKWIGRRTMNNNFYIPKDLFFLNSLIYALDCMLQPIDTGNWEEQTDLRAYLDVLEQAFETACRRYEYQKMLKNYNPN